MTGQIIVTVTLNSFRSIKIYARDNNGLLGSEPSSRPAKCDQWIDLLKHLHERGAQHEGALPAATWLVPWCFGFRPAMQSAARTRSDRLRHSKIPKRRRPGARASLAHPSITSILSPCNPSATRQLLVYLSRWRQARKLPYKKPTNTGLKDPHILFPISQIGVSNPEQPAFHF